MLAAKAKWRSFMVSKLCAGLACLWELFTKSIMNTDRENRIALFGGSFDPVQEAHIFVAQKAMEAFRLDKVIFIPARQNPLKNDAPGASAEQRLDMLKLALSEESAFEVSDLELQAEAELSYTVDTVESFRKLYPEATLFFLIGSDNLDTLHQWKSLELLFSLLDGVIVVSRHREDRKKLELNEQLSGAQKEKLREGFLDIEPVELSSTEIREALASKAFNGEGLPKKVFEYIQEKSLYRL